MRLAKNQNTKAGANLMLRQNDSFENTPNAFYQAVKTLQITKLLHRCNVCKACGKPVGEVFQFLILLAFQGKNLFRFLNSKHASSYNWKKFLLLLAAKVINTLRPLTKQSYMFHGKAYTLEQLQKTAPYKSAKECFGSMVVYTKKHHIPVKIVFVRNRNKRSECLYILSTDIELSDAEMIRIYGNH